MTQFSVAEGVYVSVTPAGAFHAAASRSQEPAARLIRRLLSLPATPTLDASGRRALGWEGAEEDFLELLYRMQALGWLEGLDAPRYAPEMTMERDVPERLAKISERRQGLLADSQGLHLVSTGFPHEAVEEIAALAASIDGLQQRFGLLLRGNLRIPATGWGVVDAAANGQLGFWPLDIGKQTFVLALAGAPDFTQPGFVELLWWLTRRYA